MVPTAGPAPAVVRESAFARRPIGHATDSTTQCNSCAKAATIAGIRYDFCSLYPGRNIPLRKCEDVCHPEAALRWEREPCPGIGVFGVLRGLIRPFPSPSERLLRSVSLPKGLNLIRPTRTCALHHSAVIRLNFVVCSVGTLPGLAPLRILSTKRRHGVACQESSPHTPSVAARRQFQGAQSRQASPFSEGEAIGFTLQNSPCIDSGLLSPLLGAAGEHQHRDRGACPDTLLRHQA